MSGAHGVGNGGIPPGLAKKMGGSGEKVKGGSGEKSAPTGNAEQASATAALVEQLDRTIQAIKDAVVANSQDSSMGVSATPTSRLASPLQPTDSFQPTTQQTVGVVNDLLSQPSGGVLSSSTGGGGKLAGGMEYLDNAGGGGKLAGGMEFLENTGGGGKLAGGME